MYKYYSKHGWNTFVRILSLVLIRGNRKQEWLHLCGLEIGEGSELSCGISAFPEPYMVTIGKKVYVAADVVFMTHDGALSWMSRALGYTDKRTDKIGSIVVKDNCFIGAKTIIMQNVTITIVLLGWGQLLLKIYQIIQLLMVYQQRLFVLRSNIWKNTRSAKTIPADGHMIRKEHTMKRSIV